MKVYPALQELHIDRYPTCTVSAVTKAPRAIQLAFLKQPPVFEYPVVRIFYRGQDLQLFLRDSCSLNLGVYRSLDLPSEAWHRCHLGDLEHGHKEID